MSNDRTARDALENLIHERDNLREVAKHREADLHAVTETLGLESGELVTGGWPAVLARIKDLLDDREGLRQERNSVIDTLHKLKAERAREAAAANMLRAGELAGLLELRMECGARDGETLHAFVHRLKDRCEVGGTWALASELDQTRSELARWKAAEERLNLQFSATARERDAYSEREEQVRAALRDVRLPGEDTLQVLRRVVTAYSRQQPPVPEGTP